MLKIFFSSVILLASLFPGRGDMSQIRKELAEEAVRRSKEYLEENPHPPDEFMAINTILEGYQELKKGKEMLPWLKRRYEIFLSGKEVLNLDIWLNKTIHPLLQILYGLGRRVEADKFIARVQQDVKGESMEEEVLKALERIREANRTVQIGDPINFTFREFSTSNQVDLIKYRGQYILLDFWVTTCDLCKKQHFFLEELYNKYQKMGLVIMGFSQDESRQTLSNYLKEHPLPWIICADVEMRHRYASRMRIPGIPYNVLLDREGKIMALNLREKVLMKKMEELFKPESAASPDLKE